MKPENKDYSIEISKLQEQLNQVRTSFNTLFQYPVDGNLELRDFDHREPFIFYRQLISAISAELKQLQEDKTVTCRRRQTIGSNPDSIDYLNSLISLSKGTPLSETLIAGALDIMTAGRLFDTEHNIKIEDDDLLYFQVKHAYVLTVFGIQIIQNYLALLNRIDKKGLSRIRPEVKTFLTINKFFHRDLQNNKQNLLTKLRVKAQEVDTFKVSRVFRYTGKEFFPAELASIRPPEKFYGYRKTREFFLNYFSAFSKKGENLPLLISSLPGLGKTHFTISYTLLFENLTLIIPEPEELSKPLEKLIRKLSLRKNKKFVIFFDDIDVRKIDWYYFRTHVGGSFVLPENISIVIASNFEFPANISSRGRSFTFPLFDEIECQGMVEDFLISMGMRHPPASLISVIAADYVEDFGQKKFDELSPRTMVRYLDSYDEDAAKRKKMLDLSREEMIAKPDSQSFYEANKKVTERLRESL